MAFRGFERGEVRRDDGNLVPAVLPLVVSASRATDLPAFHAEWFARRLAAGHVRRVNPFNARQVEFISFARTRAIVFWSKDPRPLLPHLPLLSDRGIRFYFQFTLNDYAREGYEPGVPPLAERIDAFRELSERIGRERVVWRFDPLLLSDRIDAPRLLDRVDALASALAAHTERLVTSFVDLARYPRVRGRIDRAGARIREFAPEEAASFAARLSRRILARGLALSACAEETDLSPYGIEPARCVDDRLLARMFRDDPAFLRFLGRGAGAGGSDAAPPKDRGQRPACGCVAAKDIGAYGTCRHGCLYCYAGCASGGARAARGGPSRPEDDETLGGARGR